MPPFYDDQSYWRVDVQLLNRQRQQEIELARLRRCVAVFQTLMTIIPSENVRSISLQFTSLDAGNTTPEEFILHITATLWTWPQTFALASGLVQEYGYFVVSPAGSVQFVWMDGRVFIWTSPTSTAIRNV